MNREQEKLPEAVKDVIKGRTGKFIDLTMNREQETDEKKIEEHKFILDACCGGRMFWFNKKHPNTIYIDNNPRMKGCSKARPEFECNPDIIMDFTNLNFDDKTFKLVVWDPPHMKTLGETSEFRKRFGVLNAETWQTDLKKGFKECWRVLKDYGILIFKWNEEEITLDRVLKLFDVEPLFGHRESSKSKTKWLCFMKIPDKEAISWARSQSQAEIKALKKENEELRIETTMNL